MQKHYSDLFSLMDQEEQAKSYFQTLPDYVKEQISQRADNVNSFESLQDYAENLLRGDD